jgi:IS1 family transposase/lambda repressor-like predicted transcriptional regulator
MVFMLAKMHKSSYIMSMNKLSIKARAQMLNMLCEGSSMRSVSRLADVSINTVAKLLIDAGKFCAAFHDDKVIGVQASRIQCDEIWNFTYANAKNVAAAKAAPDNAGDTWTWTGIDADTKLIVSWLVGGRDGEYAMAFMDDLRSRLANRVQLTTDGHKAYLQAVEGAFGDDVDYAILHKVYGSTPESTKGKYSPAECIGTQKHRITDEPDIKHVSTSFIERSNLTMRMQNRRFTRLTNAFSKKFESQVHMVAIWTVWYNWVRIHKSLRVTPAMQAGLTDKLLSFEEIVEAMVLVAPKAGRPKIYKKRNQEISN